MCITFLMHTHALNIREVNTLQVTAGCWVCIWLSFFYIWANPKAFVYAIKYSVVLSSSISTVALHIHIRAIEIQEETHFKNAWSEVRGWHLLSNNPQHCLNTGALLFFMKICWKAQSFAGQATNIHSDTLYRSVIILWVHIEISTKQLSVSPGFKNASYVSPETQMSNWPNKRMLNKVFSGEIRVWYL